MSNTCGNHGVCSGPFYHWNQEVQFKPYVMPKWELANLRYIHSCLIRLSHYRLRGTINYPPAHLTALIQEYRIEDLLTALWGTSLVRPGTRQAMIRAYFALLRHTASLESYGASPEIFYARKDFAPVRDEVITAIIALETDIIAAGGPIEKLEEQEIQAFP